MSSVQVFNNIKIHTQYSICEGAIKIDDIATHCKDNKIQNIGICDSYNLCGALEFAEKVSKSGTQPIIGTQINFNLEGIIGKLPLFSISSFRISLSSRASANDEVARPNLLKIKSRWPME